MNKDLEIIKECIHQIRWSDADGEYDMVIDAAERMAAEIERLKTPPCIVADNICPISTMSLEISALKCEIDRLKAEIEKFQLVATGCNDEANISQITRMVNRAIGEGREGEGSDLYWAQCWCLLREIKHLKAELEKRPEIIQCGECKHWHPIEPLENNYSPMRPQGPCMIRKDNTYFYENHFCSFGQRRESEEK